MEEDVVDSQEEKEISQESPQETSNIRSEPALSRPRRGKTKINKTAIAIIVIIILIVSAVIYILREPNINVEPLEEPAPAAQETQEPTATPTLQPLNKGEIKIDVLNGTGVAKQAAFLEEQLNSLGYENIETGNVSGNERNETTEVTFSSSLDERVKEEIKSRVEDLYKDVKESDLSLGEYDVKVIVGLRKGQVLPTDTPSPTQTEEASPTPTATVSATPAP